MLTILVRVRVLTHLMCMQSSEGEDDFEVVPQEPDDADEEMWDVENENQDEIKQAHIRSESHGFCCKHTSN